MGNITIQGDLTGDVPGGEVGGASNLATAGAIPYVSAPGILNQDPTALFWDAANDRLGIGTATPETPLQVTVASGNPTHIRVTTLSNTGSDYAAIDFTQGGAQKAVLYTNSNDLTVNTFGAMTIASSSRMSFAVASVERARFSATTGNFLIGTTTDSNFKLDVATSGSSGTARFYNQGAGVTDATKVVVRAGAGQSTTNLQEWQNSSGSVLAFVSGSAAFRVPNIGDGGEAVNLSNSGLSVRSSARINFTSTSFYYDTPDLSISRSSAGVLRVGDGGANANGQLDATRVLHVGVLVAALPAAAAGNAGSIQYVTDANATTIGTTVAGGGANKVMVWSDGAAWKIFAS